MAGSGSGSSNGVKSGFERPVIVVRKGPGGGFLMEAYESHDGKVMVTVIGCKDADHASRVIRATLQDIEREGDEARVAAIAGRGLEGVRP